MSETKMRFSGRDVTEALAAARRHFNVGRSELNYEIVAKRDVGPLENPDALIELEVWVEAGRVPPPSEERSARPERSDRGGRGDRGDRGRGDRGARGDRPARRDGGERSDRGPRRPRNDERERQARFARQQLEHVELPPLLPEQEVTDPAQIVTTLGTGLLAGLGLELTVSGVQATQSGLRLQFAGADSDLLLRDDAEGLDSLQYIVNRVLAKDRRVEAKVTLDVNGWREAQEARLIAEAKRIAEEVRQTGQERALERDLNAYERRLVHVALAEMNGVRTYSSGEGDTRCLFIAPAQ